MVTAVGLYIARQTGFIHNGLSWRPIAFLGTVSYSLYLTHNPVNAAPFFLLDKIGAPQWAALLLTLAVCVIAAYVYWWLIERPSMYLARRVSLHAWVEAKPEADHLDFESHS